MADRPNDRVPLAVQEGDVPDPKVFFVVDGKKFGRPSLETYYARTEDKESFEETTVCSCDTVTGTYCSCNKVCTCNLVCACQSVCSCVGHISCSCVGFISSGTGGTYCSCNKVCTCVPVH